MKKINAIATTLVFVAMIFILTICSVLSKDKTFSASENRYLAAKPRFSFDSLFNGNYTLEYEKYITDQFVLRDKWISLKTYSLLGLKRGDINGVYIAKDDYLIEMHDDIDEAKAYDNAHKLRQFVEGLNSTLGEGHTRVMIVPTAVYALKDKLRSHAYTFDQDTYISYIESEMPDSFVDVRDTLLNMKQEYIYYKTDHHWTTLLAYAAYKRWCEGMGTLAYGDEAFEIETVTEDFLGTIYSKVNYKSASDSINIYRLKDENITYNVDYNMGANITDSLYETSHLEKKDKYSVFLNGNNAIVDIKTSGIDKDHKRLGTLLVIKDSFAHCFVPFVANHYERCVMIDLRYLKKPVSEIIAEYEISDVLVLYNAIHFATDTNLSLLAY